MKLNFWPFNLSIRISNLEEAALKEYHHYTLSNYNGTKVMTYAYIEEIKNKLDSVAKTVLDQELKIMSVEKKKAELVDIMIDASEIKAGIAQMTDVCTTLKELTIKEGDRDKEIAGLRNRFNNVLRGQTQIDALAGLIMEFAKINGCKIEAKEGKFTVKKTAQKKTTVKSKL